MGAHRNKWDRVYGNTADLHLLSLHLNVLWWTRWAGVEPIACSFNTLQKNGVFSHCYSYIKLSEFKSNWFKVNLGKQILQLMIYFPCYVFLTMYVSSQITNHCYWLHIETCTNAIQLWQYSIIFYRIFHISGFIGIKVRLTTPTDSMSHFTQKLRNQTAVKNYMTFNSISQLDTELVSLFYILFLSVICFIH